MFVQVAGLFATTPTLPPNLGERATSARRGFRRKAALVAGKRPSNLRVKLPGLASRELLRCLAGCSPAETPAPCASGHVARSLRAVR